MLVAASCCAVFDFDCARRFHRRARRTPSHGVANCLCANSANAYVAGMPHELLLEPSALSCAALITRRRQQARCTLTVEVWVLTQDPR